MAADPTTPTPNPPGYWIEQYEAIALRALAEAAALRAELGLPPRRPNEVW